jgi:hypothetical protein
MVFRDRGGRVTDSRRQIVHKAQGFNPGTRPKPDASCRGARSIGRFVQNLTEAALNESAPTVDDDHGAGTEAFAHQIEIGFRKIFRLPDPADGQRLAGFFK